MTKHGMAVATALIAATASLAAPAAAAERFIGVSTGDSGGQCQPLTFDISVDQGKISGQATSPTRGGRGIVWEVSGSVTASGVMTMESRHQTTGVTDSRLLRIQWYGQLAGATLNLAQPASQTCNPPRTASLRRQ